MEGYSYIDIFETKGIEYLVIIAFLLLLIPFSIYMDKRVRVAGAIRHATDKLFHLGHGSFYSRSHTWARLEGNGVAKVGINGLLSGIVAEMTITPLKNSREKVEKGEVLAEIGFDGRRLKVYSPLSGMVINNNHRLNEAPPSGSDAALNHKWICEIQPVKWQEEAVHFIPTEEVAAWFGKELARLRDFLAARVPQPSPLLAEVVLQDGGEISPDILRHIPAAAWHDFQKEFLEPEESTDQSL
jgi:glycine cleavage system H protein